MLKGPDYKIAENDTAGNLKKKTAVERIGGKLIFTEGATFLSSSLMNSKFEDIIQQKNYI